MLSIFTCRCCTRTFEKKKRGQKFQSDKLKTERDFNRGVISPVVSPISSFFLPVIGFARRSYVYEIKNHTWTLQFHPDRPGDDASCDSTPTQHNKTCCNLPTEKISSYNFEFIVALPLCSHFCKSPPSLFIRFTDKFFPCFVLKYASLSSSSSSASSSKQRNISTVNYFS